MLLPFPGSYLVYSRQDVTACSKTRSTNQQNHWHIDEKKSLGVEAVAQAVGYLSSKSGALGVSIS